MDGAARQASLFPRKGDPKFFDVFKAESISTRDTPYGRVGSLYADNAIEMVWVSKQGEAIDPGWFSSNLIDLIVVLKGQLKVEFEENRSPQRVMNPGEVLILPPGTRCRAYRWPRDVETPTVFIATYPAAGSD